MPPGLIITTSMGRRAHLEHALPTWLEHTDADILVVDHACPDGTAAWARGLGEPRVRAVEVSEELVLRHAERTLADRTVFSKPLALNVALAPLAPDELVALLDADTVVPGPAFWGIARHVNHGRVLFMTPSRLARDLTGVLVTHVSELQNIGGYDEGMLGWGAEDLDVRMRLYRAGTIPEWLPEGVLESLPHDDALRTAHYQNRDHHVTNILNTSRMLQKLGAMTTEQAQALVRRDPMISRLLGLPI